MGITMCGELGRAPLPLLTKRFGVMGERLKATGNGKLDRPLEFVPPESVMPPGTEVGRELSPSLIILSRMPFLLPTLWLQPVRSGRRNDP